MVFENLVGSTLRITTRYKNLYTYDVRVKKIPSENGYTFVGGYAAEIFQNLQEILGFNYVFLQDVDAYNFSVAENRSVDLYVGSYSLYYSRAKIVDPTFVTGNSKIISLINHEHEGSTQDIFMLPFSKLLWFGLFLFFLACLGIVVLMGWTQNYAVQDSVFHTAAVVLQKGCPWVDNKLTFQIAFTTISVCTIIVMGCYTGNMFSIKAVNRFIINSVQSLIDSSHYKIITELGHRDSSIRVMLDGLLHLPLVQKLVTRINSANYAYTTFEDAIKEVLIRPTAYIIDEETAISTIANELGQFPCSWSAFPVLNLKYPWSMFMRKNSPFKTAINYGLLRLDEIGVRKRLRNKWIPHASECQMNSLPFTSIKLTQTYGAFSVYTVGAFLAIIWYILFEMKHNFQSWFRKTKGYTIKL